LAHFYFSLQKYKNEPKMSLKMKQRMATVKPPNYKHNRAKLFDKSNAVTNGALRYKCMATKGASQPKEKVTNFINTNINVE
jgi:hypothetical protein